MSYEAWGSPPDVEPERCPLCDGTSHIPGCEIRELEARYRKRIEAEGFTVLKTMLEVFDIMNNPAQFRSALAAAVAKRQPKTKQ